MWSKLKQISFEHEPTTEPTPSDKIFLWLSCLRSSIKFCLLLKVLPSQKILLNEEKECLVCLNTYQVIRSLHILKTLEAQEKEKECVMSALLENGYPGGSSTRVQVPPLPSPP